MHVNRKKFEWNSSLVYYHMNYIVKEYSRLSFNGHLYKTDTSVKRTPRVGPCLCLFHLFDSL